MREAHPKVEVEAWAQDEHRLGLKPILRRVSGPAGANDCWRLEDLDELEGVLVSRCSALSDMPETLRLHTRFHWWIEVES